MRPPLTAARAGWPSSRSPSAWPSPVTKPRADRRDLDRAPAANRLMTHTGSAAPRRFARRRARVPKCVRPQLRLAVRAARPRRDRSPPPAGRPRPSTCPAGGAAAAVRPGRTPPGDEGRVQFHGLGPSGAAQRVRVPAPRATGPGRVVGFICRVQGAGRRRAGRGCPDLHLDAGSSRGMWQPRSARSSAPAPQFRTRAARGAKNGCGQDETGAQPKANEGNRLTPRRYRG